MAYLSEVGIGKNIGYGVLFFVIIAIACGLGCFISIVASTEEMALFGFLGSIMVIFSGPIVALIVGIVQGKTARNSGEALVAGGVTGVVGYILLLIILVALIAAAFMIKYPPSDGGDDDINGDDDGADINWGEMFTQFVAIFLPSGIIGAFAAFFSNKFIFAAPRVSGPPQVAAAYPPQPAVVSQPQQPQPSPQPAVQPSLDARFMNMRCPTCGATFDTMVPDRPTKISCPSCGQEGIIGL